MFMNQTIQRRVYQLGNKDQVAFIADISGMDGEVRTAFEMLHSGCKETQICDALGCSIDAYHNIEDMIKTKLTIGIFECINIARSQNKR